MLAWGCSQAHQPPAQVAASGPSEESLPPLEGTGLEQNGVELAARDARQVGDYAVHRFSGTFLDRPFTLTEEVVGEDGSAIVVDYTLERADEKQVLRVRFDSGTERVLRVSHVQQGEERPAPLSAYEELMSMTSFAPDMNDGLVSRDKETCLLGRQALDCELEQFRVTVGDREATLRVSHSPELERDVGGEVRAVDGTILYRTELVDLRRGGQSILGEANARRTR